MDKEQPNIIVEWSIGFAVCFVAYSSLNATFKDPSPLLTALLSIVAFILIPIVIGKVVLWLIARSRKTLIKQ